MDEKLLIYRNETVNDVVLAFKYDEETAFYIENPSSEDFQNFADALEVKEWNYLYASFQDNLLYALRKDKSFYAVYLFTKQHTKGVVVTNKNSVKIIADRFAEGSLFDGRVNEKRYLKEENWYHYEDSERVEHPLKGQPLRNIGKIVPAMDLLCIDTALQTHLKNPLSYLNELANEYMYREIADGTFTVNTRRTSPLKFESFDIQQIETILTCTISNFYRLKSTIFIPYPNTAIIKKKLMQLPYSYRFITENKWNIRLASEKERFKNYFIVIEWDYQGQSFFFDIRGYHPRLFNQLFNSLDALDRLSIGIARPLKSGENKAKSISIDYRIEEKIFSTSINDDFTKSELLDFLNQWVD